MPKTKEIDALGALCAFSFIFGGSVTGVSGATVGWREVASVLLGGMVGTAARLGIDLMLPHGDAEFPLGTLIINVAGSLLLGLAVSTIWQRVPTWLRAGLGAGLLGAFTTFSAVMVSMVAMGASGEWMLAIGYLLASLVLGLGAAILGLKLGRRSTAGEWVGE